VVNLQPIEKMTETKGTTMEEVLEQTDIGGAAMIRSAAKNFRYVTVVVNPERYTTVVHELRAYEGEVSYETRYRLAQEAFCCTAAYDKKIADLLKENEPPKG
jgi:phosphoribosylaminoimidazolecarboxamide formyltransferase/IMP cyclohydrolase